MKIKRYVSIYDKVTESFLTKIDVSHLDLDKLKSCVDYGLDHLLYLCYEIVILGELHKFLNDYGLNFDFDKFYYYLEAEAEE